MLLFQPIALCSIVIALLLVFVVKIAYRAFKNPLRHVPGPWYSAYTHCVLKLKTMTGRRMFYVHSLHIQYGPVVRISPWQVAVEDLKGFSAIHRIGSGFIKSKWYEELMTGAVGGTPFFAMPNPKDHAARRKLFARPFSMAFLRENCEDIIRAKVEKAVGRIHEEASRGNSDVLKWWMLMASDVIGTLSFGESFELLEAGKKNQYVEVLEAAALSTTLQHELPLLYHICRFIPVKTIQLLLNSGHKLIAFGRQAVTKLHRHNHEKTLFANMVAHNESTGKSQAVLSDEDIRIEASDFILAGADTTSNTLTYIMWSILQHPDLHTRLVEELKSLGEQFNDAALEGLPLLNAVIQESLRLYGAVPGNLPRVVPATGITISDHFIPAGFEVETQAYSMHRNPDIWPDPFRFDETRWLDPALLTPEQKASFCPFGVGTRVCIGIHLAKMELRLGTALLLKRCPGLKLAEIMNDSMMEMYNFFLAGPVGKRCDVTLL
ncbi:hypothetical protein NM208_g5051 [Fusarium decemcellulare]|uniref:Uncharacterized protein n=1 Tax=Fusarium decemcellulare TaxID=57161 RepID=A0ACC1SIH1_9HYPO|nr:hypothetical protein NM208_g5051 [Fusarium decemcellulare]